MAIDSRTIPEPPGQPLPYQTLPPKSLLYRSLEDKGWQVSRASRTVRALPRVRHYQIVRIIAKGGFGTTYLACDPQHPDLGQYAIKQLNLAKSKTASNPDRQEFLRREARLLAQLGKHPQIPQFIESFAADDEFYIVQTFIEGNSLKDGLVEGYGWTEYQTVEFLQQMLNILRFIHDRGVIHRDIKPSNIIRNRQQKFCLIDFGAAKQLTGHWGETATVIGSRGYAAPEQMQGHPRLNSDLYALGIVALEALTGIPAYHLHNGGAEGPVGLSNYSIGCGLAAILAKLVQQDWRSRYPLADDVLGDLSELSV